MKGRLMSVTVDFIELDFMRTTITEFGKRIGFRLPMKKRTYWTESGFYIGRSVVRFYFNDILFLDNPNYRSALMAEMVQLYGDDYIISRFMNDIILVQKPGR